MKKFKRIARLTGFVLLMILASVGIGLTGAAPIFPKNKERNQHLEINTELVETKEEETNTTQPGAVKG